MLLIANGCSHTAGAEIEHPYQGRCYSRAWPKKIADKLGFDHLNLSFSGASCERVVRTTIQRLHTLKKQSNFNPENIFFVIMWPDIWRYEIFATREHESGFHDNDWCPLVSGNDEIYKEQLSKSAYVYYKAWMMRINQYQESIRWYNNILLLQNIFVSHKIKYMFYQSSQSLPTNVISEYTSLINKKRFPTFNIRELNYCALLENNGFSWGPNSKFGHYGEDAQDWFSDYMIKLIDKNMLL